ncbi:cell division protein ZapE [Frankia sp. Cppng1_Ct_nod]|uniref:cell division protein ZapE n=1 Tax=Frankia sp. Cppng1_Ct_nod TaxID=2897162 RepID=UPI001040E4C9|nr:cell division protein ZapE [Frankia sp. Cppng1_Ct_nod]
MPERLVDRHPEIRPDDLVASLVPPPRFNDVRFATYRPDPSEPSQTAAVVALGRFAEHVTPGSGRAGRSSGAGTGGGRGLLRIGRRDHGGRATRHGGGTDGGTDGGAGAGSGRPGVYLDGGFGVGKTHLLASLWHAAPAPKAYGTFVEITSLVGALGFARTVDALAGLRLLAIDEFELDDPGDTVLVSTLLTRLVEAGVSLAATSNTQPDDLGAGRFGADDFLREIQGLSSRFEVLRVEGEDFRHRGLPDPPAPVDDDEVTRRARAIAGASEDGFAELCAHLAGLHPSRYGALVDDVELVCLHGVTAVPDQAVALRLVVLADRLYDRSVPVVASGRPFGDLFSPEMLAGPHRKKFQRAVSRLSALARDGGSAGLGVPEGSATAGS